MAWKIDSSVRRGDGSDDDDLTPNLTATADWRCWLRSTDGDNLLLQFQRKNIDRAKAEKIVKACLDGLNQSELVSA